MAPRRSRPPKRPVIRVRTSRHGTLHLRPIVSVRDLSDLTNLRTDDQSARALTAQVLHQQLIAPPLELDVVEAWPDRLLSRVARLFAADKNTFGTELSEAENAFGGFRDALDARLSEEQKTFRAALSPLSGQVAHMMRELGKMPEFKILPIKLPKFAVPPIQADMLRSLTQAQQFALTMQRSPALHMLREQPLVLSPESRGPSSGKSEPSAWDRVERQVGVMRDLLQQAVAEEEFQAVGLLCREVLISVAEAVYDRTKHPPTDGVEPSKSDAKRRLDAYFSVALRGGSYQEARKSAKASLDHANKVQHDRNATLADASLCAVITIAVVNSVAVVEGMQQRF